MKKWIKKVKEKSINQETILYTIFGVFTSALNVGLFQMLLMANIEYKVANFITLIVVKLVAYICNKKFVFKSKCSSIKELLKEIWRYIITRGFTMAVDYFALIVMIDLMNWSELLSKVVATVGVVILNYILGKKHVFKK